MVELTPIRVKFRDSPHYRVPLIQLKISPSEKHNSQEGSGSLDGVIYLFIYFLLHPLMELYL